MTAAQRLGELGLSVEFARTWIFDNLNDVDAIYSVCQYFSINNDMIAEIIDMGITGQGVANFFNAHGLDGNALGFSDDNSGVRVSEDYVWNPFTQTWDDIGDAAENSYNSDSITIGSLNHTYDGYAKGTADTTDTDFYRFTAPADGTMEFYLNDMDTSNSSDLDLALYGGFGVELASDSKAGDSEESFSYTVTAGTTYYLGVSSNSGSDDYELGFYMDNVTSTSNDDHIWDPYYYSWTLLGDAGDTSSTADTISIGSYSHDYDGFAYGSASISDSDYYQFTAPVSGYVYINLEDTDTTNSSDLDLKLLDSSGSTLESSVGLTSDESLSYYVNSGYTYQINIYSAGGDDNYYLGFYFDTTSSTSAEDYVWNDLLSAWDSIGDAGDDYYSADTIAIGSYSHAYDGFAHGTASESDFDYYQFTAPISGTLNLELEDKDTTNTSDLDLYLYDTSGTELAYSEAFYTTDESLTASVFIGTTYVIGVKGYEGTDDYGVNFHIS